MKPIYLPAIIILLASSCKKETSELITVQPQEAINSPHCYGNTWTADVQYEGTIKAPCLVYNNKVYFFNRLSYHPGNDYDNTVTIYDGTSWQTLPTNIPFFTNAHSYEFVIGNRGYIGVYDNLLYEYNFATNTWAAKAGFPGEARNHPAVFVIGNKGYVTGGARNGTHYNDLWEYSPILNSWIERASFPDWPRFAATGFTIGNKGYIVNGKIFSSEPTSYTYYFNDLLEYNPTTDSWTKKAPFPGEARAYANAFVISGLAYIGSGYAESFNPNDYYKYNPATNAWSSAASLQIPANKIAYQGFSINSRGYVVYPAGNNIENLQKYTPLVCPPLISNNANSGSNTIN